MRSESGLRPHYDYIVCGSGAAGSVVAGRLAANLEVSVLLLEAGGSDLGETISRARSYPLARHPHLFWHFHSQPEDALNGRSIRMLMGNVLGGGSSVNTMVWARGHRSDFDAWAEAAGDPAWNYSHALELYRQIENWQGEPDPARRGTGGPVWVQTAQNPSPLAPAMVAGAASIGIPAYADHNGSMMEGPGGAAIANLIVKDGLRRNMPLSYLAPVMHQANLTVLTSALVHRVTIEKAKATGVAFAYNNAFHTVGATQEVVLSMGAFNTPRTLMLSGLGDESELRRLGIPVTNSLPGVGRNFQDHTMVASCMWEAPEPLEPRNNKAEATFFWRSKDGMSAPDVQPFLIELPHASNEHVHRASPNAWSLAPAIIRPRSRGRLRLRSADPSDDIDLFWNPLGEAEDLRVLNVATDLCREIGNSPPMRQFVKREIMPGPASAKDRDAFIRNGAVSYGHATCTAKMGRDVWSVVDSQLKVYGIGNLRIADGSIMPNITLGNTMAPCVLIGERCSQLLKAEW
jgi:choline dehydrogenase-like flavoprotein